MMTILNCGISLTRVALDWKAKLWMVSLSLHSLRVRGRRLGLLDHSHLGLFRYSSVVVQAKENLRLHMLLALRVQSNARRNRAAGLALEADTIVGASALANGHITYEYRFTADHIDRVDHFLLARVPCDC